MIIKGGKKDEVRVGVVGDEAVSEIEGLSVEQSETSAAVGVGKSRVEVIHVFGRKARKKGALDNRLRREKLKSLHTELRKKVRVAGKLDKRASQIGSRTGGDVDKSLFLARIREEGLVGRALSLLSRRDVITHSDRWKLE